VPRPRSRRRTASGWRSMSGRCTRGSEDLVLDHYLEILSRKPGAPRRGHRSGGGARLRVVDGHASTVLGGRPSSVRRRARHPGPDRGAVAARTMSTASVGVGIGRGAAAGPARPRPGRGAGPPGRHRTELGTGPGPGRRGAHLGGAAGRAHPDRLRRPAHHHQHRRPRRGRPDDRGTGPGRAGMTAPTGTRPGARTTTAGSGMSGRSYQSR